MGFWEVAETEYMKEVKAEQQEEIPSTPLFHLVILKGLVDDLEEMLERGEAEESKNWLTAIAGYCRLIADNISECKYRNGLWSVTQWGDAWAEIHFSSGDVITIEAEEDNERFLIYRDDGMGNREPLEQVRPYELDRAFRDYVESEIESFSQAEKVDV